MNRRSLVSSLAIVLGMLFVASFSIQHNSFYSGMAGIIGCLLIVAGFIGSRWSKVQAGDKKIKRTISILIVLCGILIVLNIITRVI